jgi:uncharacterized protein
MIKTFDHIETFLVRSGIFPVKVRYIQNGIRIETPPENFSAILEKREEIIDTCKGSGITFVTLDLEGIKSGVWD